MAGEGGSLIASGPSASFWPSHLGPASCSATRLASHCRPSTHLQLAGPGTAAVTGPQGLTSPLSRIGFECWLCRRPYRQMFSPGPIIVTRRVREWPSLSSFGRRLELAAQVRVGRVCSVHQCSSLSLEPCAALRRQGSLRLTSTRNAAAESYGAAARGSAELPSPTRRGRCGQWLPVPQ